MAGGAEAQKKEGKILRGELGAVLEDAQAILSLDAGEVIVPRMLGNEIFDGGQHSVPWAAFVDGVEVNAVGAFGVGQLAAASNDAFALVFLAELGGNGLRLVIHIAAAVGTADVVEEDHSAGRQQVPLADEAQFVRDGIPVVIAINEDAIKGDVQMREGIEAVVLENRYAWVAGVFLNQIGIEAGVEDGVGDVGQREEFIGAEAGAGANFAEAFPTALSCEG